MENRENKPLRFTNINQVFSSHLAHHLQKAKIDISEGRRPRTFLRLNHHFAYLSHSGNATNK
ncbi:Transposase [Caenorhabditis elegans]|uniref:Transposase n=1 Tax=Caenorhabditis elegans TaxID=6239 RepID=U4PEP7_CAEEL|nr:Transposase [Caenorhabditis elegans]CDH93207.1 Transposase [Caenorhabditis elegans]|eukprot:NP_001294761.1 Uncharacterized protein CELE_F37B4.15 [Caenorhabditis elegans]